MPLHTPRAFAPILLLFVVGPLVGQESNPRRLIDFDAGTDRDWIAVNDGVMGGRSSSDLAVGDDGIGVFTGNLSLENNGGFASVRTAVPDAALAGASRIVLRVRGDGRRYQLRLRHGRRFDGISYTASFETTADDWSTVTLPLGTFEPTFRGYRPRNAEPLDPPRVGQVGIMLSDGQEGPFRLEIDWIGIG